VKVHEFKGKVYVDIREFYESDGELKPSRKGGCIKNLSCYVHLRVYVYSFCQVNLPHLFFHASYASTALKDCFIPSPAMQSPEKLGTNLVLHVVHLTYTRD